MAVISQASHSVTDFNDSPAVDLFIQNNISTTQVYNGDINAFATQDWTANNLILTPFVTVSGRTGNQVTQTTNGTVTNVDWFYLNNTGTRVSITGSAADPDDFTFTTATTAGTARALTVLHNIVGDNPLESANIRVGGTVTIVCSITYTDPIFGDLTRERSVTLTGAEQAGSAFLAVLNSSNGNFFSPAQQNDITLTCNLFLGGNDISEGAHGEAATYVFTKNGTTTTTGVGTTAFGDTLTTNGSNTDRFVNQILITPDDVAGSALYGSTVTYEGTQMTASTFSINDVADEYRVNTPTSLVIRNNQAAATGMYSIIKNGVSVTSNPGTGFNMIFRKFTDDGTGLTATEWDTTILAAARSGTTGITVTYHDVVDGAVVTTGTAPIMQLTYGATATASQMNMIINADEITSVADEVTTVTVDLRDSDP